MATEINKVTGIVVGQYGEAIVLQVVDDDGNAIDISAYTTSKICTLRDPFTNKSFDATATFVTDGTNGQFQFTPTAGQFDRSGTWEGQLKLESASALKFSVTFEVEVGKRISAST